MRRSLLAGVVLALLVGGTAAAGGRLALVAGQYTYQLNGGTSEVRLLAVGRPGDVRGTLMFRGSYIDFDGTVTCVTVKGADAWVAGVIDDPDEVGFDGWMVRVKDHGIRDRAVTFIDDAAVARAWCEEMRRDGVEYLQPLVDGWVVVR